MMGNRKCRKRERADLARTVALYGLWNCQFPRVIEIALTAATADPPQMGRRRLGNTHRSSCHCHW